jgi:sodium/potassium-transporting ATPase subunit alpha
LRKKRALRRSKTIRADTEGQGYKGPSKISDFFASVKAPFTRVFWEEFFEKKEEETLVDMKVISYAYLEAGMIEFLAG